MAYDFSDTRQPIPVEIEEVLNTSNKGKSITCSINPESVKESVSLNMDKVQLINNNLPRTITSGTRGRTVSFSILLHGMSAPKSSSKAGFTAGNFNTFASAAVSLIPFAANVIRGIQTIQDVIGDVTKSAEYAARLQDTDYLNVDQQIATLFSMQVPEDGKTVHNTVRIVGYKAFTGLNFYIESIEVTRKMWDPILRTMFAEVQITLFQTGKKDRFGGF